ncbi:MAG TPA: desulfoferrodoxin [bacterium]|nr:desulfoferrodoxin [bacterium]
MTEMLQVYRCEVCGNVVEMLHTGVGELVCCGEPMKLYAENTTDAALEKHVPVIEKLGSGSQILTRGLGGSRGPRFKVQVGSVAHPMLEKHYIEWIELLADGKAYRQFLKPGDAPEATFCVEADKVTVREYCNVHGLWKKEL